MSRIREIFSERYEGWPPVGTKCAWMGRDTFLKGVITGELERYRGAGADYRIPFQFSDCQDIDPDDWTFEDDELNTYMYGEEEGPQSADYGFFVRKEEKA